MKRLQILVLTSLMVVGFATLALGVGVNVAGDAAAMWIHNDSYNGYGYEYNINLSGQLEKDFSFYIDLKAGDGHVVEADSQPNQASADSYIYESYGLYKEDWGELKLGMMNYQPYCTILINEANAAIGRLKSPLTVNYTTPKVNRDFTFQAYYFGNAVAQGYADADEGLKKDAFALVADYQKEWLDVNLNYAKHLVNTTGDSKDDAYALNIKLIGKRSGAAPFANSVYLHYGEDQDSQKMAIVGFYRQLAEKIGFCAEADVMDEVTPDYTRRYLRLYYYPNGHSYFSVSNAATAESMKEAISVRFGYVFF